MDKSDLAIGIALVSACFTGGSLFYTRILARNDSRRMRRKPLSLEMDFVTDGETQGWDYLYLIIRNLEPTSARVLSLRAKRKGSQLLLADDARTETDAFGTPIGFDPTKAAQTVTLNRKIPPFGHMIENGTRQAEFQIYVYSKGISSAEDLKLDWEWSDGTKI